MNYVCSYCGYPILDLEADLKPGGWHYECKLAMERMDEDLRARRRPRTLWNTSW